VNDKRQISWWRRRWVKVAAACFLVVVVGLGGAAEYVLHNAGPIVKKRVVETLSTRFSVPVQLDSLQISLMHGIEVEGDGLRIPYVGDGQTKPMINVRHFAFRTTFKGLLHQPTHLFAIHADGIEVDLPPGKGRVDALTGNKSKQPSRTKISFTAAEILCTNVKLILETDKPGKDPIELDIQRMKLTDVGLDQPMAYEAEVINPKPVGQIHAKGHFGPWNTDDPRATPLDGNYSFDHADLNTIKGIGGILSSTGNFEGELGNITIDGTTDVPDFSLDVSNHPVPLHTVFHAVVDGTTGDTTLDPVQAHMLHSDFVCRGKVALFRGEGHDISLDVTMTHARIEDMLQLGVKTEPPLMRGALAMQAKLHIPPGPVRVAQKIELVGKFSVQGVDFGNPKWQDKIDSLSMRAQGKPEDAKAAGSDGKAEVQSTMAARFNLNHGTILVDDLKYQIPGAVVLLNGVYSADGKLFDFRGHVRTDAQASQMVTGWKSILLMPVDKFLKKNGAGMELPISISGTGGDVKLGLAMHGADESSAQIAAELGATKGKPASPK